MEITTPSDKNIAYEIVPIEQLQQLVEMGFQPLPLTGNCAGQIPNVADLLTPDEIEEGRNEDKFGEVRPVNYIKNHPDFWTCERLRKEAWRFHNVATTLGKTVIDGKTLYRYEIDIDSQAAYDHFVELIGKEKNNGKTIIVKTKKPYGYHMYWFEETSQRNIFTSYCKAGKEFEIKCESGQSTLPPSCHRDDDQFRYTFYGNGKKIGVFNGFYSQTLEVLKDCLKENWNKEKSDTIIEESKNLKYTDLNEDQISQSVNRLRFLYVKGFRNPFVYELSGLAFNNRISLNSCLELIKLLARECSDEEIKSRLLVVKNTYHNGELGKKISGYSGFVGLLTSLKGYMDVSAAESFIMDFIDEVWGIHTDSVSKTDDTARNKKSDTEKPKKTVKCFKYSGNGKISLHESIIISKHAKFVSYDYKTEKIEIKDSIVEETRTITPFDLDDYPNMPYDFDSEKELHEYIKRAKMETKDTLFYKIQNIVTKYVDQDENITTQLAIDTQISYAQDLFSTIHYDFAVGSNEVGKSAIGFVFEGLGYRPVKGTGMSAANYYRILGITEPGQCTIIEDEADGIDEDKDKMKILKTGYEYGAKIPKINMNTKDQGQQWFYTYNFKLLLAENSPRIHKARGVLDRTFMMHPRPGIPKEKMSIKDVLTAKSRIGNASENSRELKLYNEIDDLRKLLICHRLIHHDVPLPEIESGLRGRNAELANPTLRYFYGCDCIKYVVSSLEHHLNQRKQRNTNTVEAAIYPIISKLISKGGSLEVRFKDIWEEIRMEIPSISCINDNDVAGEDRFIRSGRDVTVVSKEKLDPTKHVTEDYGVLYYNTISDLVLDKFGNGKKKSNAGIVICFDKDKIAQFESRYGKTERVKIDLKLVVHGDGSDASDADSGRCVAEKC